MNAMDFKLRDYQTDLSNKAVTVLLEHNIVYISCETRTGKTLMALQTANLYGSKKVLFVTKKKAIASIHTDYALLNPSFAIEVINYESLHKLEQTDYDLIIVDEAHKVGSGYPKPSIATKQLKVICKDKPIIYVSATPTPESFSQVFFTFFISSYSPFKQYANFYKWAKDYVFVTQRFLYGHNVNVYNKANEKLIDEKTKHLFVSITQNEAGFNDEIQDVIHFVNMNNQTKHIIRTLKRDKVVTGKTGSIMADTAVREMQSIHQLGSGTIRLDNEQAVTIDDNKAVYLRDKFHGKKIAILYNFIQELDLLKSFFPNWTNSPEKFNQSDDLTFLGQIVSAREGVSLKTADELIFFNVPFSATSYLQGRGRTAHKERLNGCRAHFLLSDCGIDEYVYKTVKSKENFTLHYYKDAVRKQGTGRNNPVLQA